MRVIVQIKYKVVYCYHFLHCIYNVIVSFLPPSLHTVALFKQLLKVNTPKPCPLLATWPTVWCHMTSQEREGEEEGKKPMRMSWWPWPSPGHAHPGPLKQPVPPAPSTRLVVSMPYHRLVQELGWRNQPMQSSLINRTCRTEHAV